jgi:predicted nucleic acid-binding protein
MSGFDTPTQRVFFDTNVLVYCFDNTEPQKQARAKDLLAQALNARLGVVSYQVVQEFCNVACAKKRLNLPHERIQAYIDLVLQPMNLVAPSSELLASALQVRSANGFAFYDSLIIAAAQAANCQVLYSEDLQHLQRIGELQILNPFVLAVNE